MNLHWIDWTIVFGIVAFMVGISVYCKCYTRSPADFLAANRLAGKYLLTVSTGMTGAIGMIATWQMINTAGLSTQWWGMMGIPVGLVIASTGFITYRFRQTRCLTLAQFFEVRYSRKFRFYAGALSWISGILNYGVFPAVTSRLIITFLGLPENFMLGGIQVSTFVAVMVSYLTIAVFIACCGGQISIMISDFFQEFICKIILIAIIFFLFYKFSWNDIIAGLDQAPPGRSMYNPFDSSKVESFNIWYFLIGLFGSIYNARSWQGTSGYNAAAKTPHDAQMGGILAGWRNLAYNLCLLLPPLIAYAVFHNSIYAELAAEIQGGLDLIADPQARNQMITPMFLTKVLPIGLLGGCAALVISGTISCDDTYTHAWGTIFVQDVVMPLRKEPFKPKTHLLLLRLSVIGVAVFGFIFSMLFPLKDFILMFFALTGAIYLGGAGIVIIGGLYWKHGTTAGAATAMTVGTILAFGGILIEQLWPKYLSLWMIECFPNSEYLAAHADKFPVNGQIIYFIAMVAAVLSYVLVSLLGPKRIHNMDKLLHRGRYTVDSDLVTTTNALQKKSIAEKLGLTKEFSRFERFVFWGTNCWSMGWWGIFFIGTVICLLFEVPDQVWSWFWFLKIWVSVILGPITTAWILTGGLRDAFHLFKDLKQQRTSDHDDGFVQ